MQEVKGYVRDGRLCVTLACELQQLVDHGTHRDWKGHLLSIHLLVRKIRPRWATLFA